MTWYVYIVCCSDNSLYTGITNNLERRINAHNSSKGAKYTRGRTPVVLVYAEQVGNKSQALKREIDIKKLSKAEKLELINKGTNEFIK